LQRCVLWIKLKRDRRLAVGEFGEEYREPVAGALDHVARLFQILRRPLLEVREMLLNLVGEGDYRLEPDHLDRPGRLMHVGARVLERDHLAGRFLERYERLEGALQRLVDLALDPG
jgi:hypothetical protein